MTGENGVPETPDWQLPRDGLTPAQREQLRERFRKGIGSREERELPERFVLGDN